MLEDDYTYVIRKALRGLALTPGEAALRAGLPEKDMVAFSNGEFSETSARKLAQVLNLNPEALAQHPSYLPRSLTLPEIRRLDLPFNEERVNAWLLTTADTTILFDTGYEPQSCARAFQTELPNQIFITHAHPDHLGGLPSFLTKGIPVYGAENIDYARLTHPGDEIRSHSLTLRACDLSGHASPALGYHITGLAHPVLVTGDALFAGSIGGCSTPAIYQHALHRLHAELSGLPDETILLPGHGPGTTLGEERRSNPFLA